MNTASLQNKDLTFKQAAAILKEGKFDPKFLDNIELLIGLIGLLTPVALPGVPGIVAIAAAVGSAKGDLFKMGKALCKQVIEKKDNPTFGRIEKMRFVYTYITYAAFFEALEKECPELHKQIALLSTDEWKLAQNLPALLEADKTPLLNLPHPAYDLLKQSEAHLGLYFSLVPELITRIHSINVIHPSKLTFYDEIIKSLDDLPYHAMRYFEAQYYNLCVDFPEFALWGDLRNHAAQSEALGDVLKQLDAMRGNFDKQDLGFNQITTYFEKFESRLDAQVDAIVHGDARDTLAELRTRYTNLIAESVLPEADAPKYHNQALTFPKKEEIFLPQAFKVARYAASNSIASDEFWDGISARDELSGYLAAYCNSSQADTMPLLILGQPGSGKSLLTQIFAARSAEQNQPVVRVELRNVTADADIADQIQEQWKEDGVGALEWAKFSRALEGQPVTVILDGYDELLQASGEVHKDYLKKVQKFQKDEILNGHAPVRVIVTSRPNLINKTQIPDGATLLRLEAFDEGRIERWLDIWNDKNRNYFINTGLKKFMLPANAENVRELAKQPLLLMMLAIYDAYGNPLHKAQNLDRTSLYYDLLSQFVKRELQRFNPEEPDEDLIADELELLGVVAMGMFNRRALSISDAQLQADVALFQCANADRGKPKNQRNPLKEQISEAQGILNSFFFIQKSQSHEFEDANLANRKALSYEFLHNTFGEFLVADFLLTKFLRVARKLYGEAQESPRDSDRDALLNDFNRLKNDWYGGLMIQPLASRPVVLEMIREWFPHKFKQSPQAPDVLLEQFDALAVAHLRNIVEGNIFPNLMLDIKDNGFPRLSLLNYLANYSINLVSLLAVLHPDGFDFWDIDNFDSKLQGEDWYVLRSLWMSWFRGSELKEVCAIFTTENNAFRLRIAAKDVFHVMVEDDGSDTHYAIGHALGDNSLAYYAALYTSDSLIIRANALETTENTSYFRTVRTSWHILTQKMQIARRLNQDNGTKQYLFNDVMKQLRYVYANDAMLPEPNESTLRMDAMPMLLEAMLIAIEIGPVPIKEYEGLLEYGSENPDFSLTEPFVNAALRYGIKHVNIAEFRKRIWSRLSKIEVRCLPIDVFIYLLDERYEGKTVRVYNEINELYRTMALLKEKDDAKLRALGKNLRDISENIPSSMEILHKAIRETPFIVGEDDSVDGEGSSTQNEDVSI